MLLDPDGRCPVCLVILANPAVRGAAIGAGVYLAGRIGTNLLYNRPLLQGVEGRELLLSAAVGAVTGGLSMDLIDRTIIGGVSATQAATINWLATGGLSRTSVPQGQDLTEIVVKGATGGLAGAGGDSAAGTAIAVGLEIGQNVVLDVAGATPPGTSIPFSGGPSPK